MQTRLVLRLSLCLFAVTFAVFSSVVTHDFLYYDDSKYVFNNRVVRCGLTWQGWCWSWTAVHCSNWHPLTWLSHMLDCQLFGLQRPGGHHLTSLLLHSANALLVFHVLRRLTKETWRPILVAGLFALHPLRVESVAWVAERKDVLSMFFGLLALWSYAVYAESPALWRYLLVLVFFALSLLSKPMLVTLPFVLLLLDYWPLQRFRTRVLPLVLEKCPLLVLSAASCVMTFLAQRQLAVVSTLALPVSVRLSNALAAYAGYLVKMLWPVNLAVFYPHPGPSLTIAEVAGSAGVLLLLTRLAVGLRKQQPALLVGWLWYLGTLVPVIGLVQVGNQAVADRYTYFPLLGVFLALAWSIPSRLGTWPLGRALLAAGGVAVLTACAVLTWWQLRSWQNEGTVWRQALAGDPQEPGRSDLPGDLPLQSRTDRRGGGPFPASAGACVRVSGGTEQPGRSPVTPGKGR